jgi:hypothetical protein
MFSFLRCGCRTANGRRRYGLACGCGFLFVVEESLESRHDMAMSVFERDGHGIVGKGMCAGERVRQKEEGNCDGRDLDSSFVI